MKPKSRNTFDSTFSAVLFGSQKLPLANYIFTSAMLNYCETMLFDEKNGLEAFPKNSIVSKEALEKDISLLYNLLQLQVGHIVVSDSHSGKCGKAQGKVIIRCINCLRRDWKIKQAPKSTKLGDKIFSQTPFFSFGKTGLVSYRIREILFECFSDFGLEQQLDDEKGERRLKSTCDIRANLIETTMSIEGADNTLLKEYQDIDDGDIYVKVASTNAITQAVQELNDALFQTSYPFPFSPNKAKIIEEL